MTQHRLGLIFVIGTLLPCLVGLAAPAAEPAVPKVVVHIHGIQGELLDNVRAALSLERRKNDPLLSAEPIRGLHRRAEREIHRALQPFGYYRPRIDSELLPPDDADTPWQAHYRIDPKDPVTLGPVDLALLGPGADDADLQPLLADFPLSAGAILRHQRYTEGKRELLREARRLGYLDAAFSAQRIEVDPVAYSAALTLHLQTGQRYRFGRVEFVQEGFDAAYLYSFLPFKTGEAFQQERLTRMRRALGASGHFRQVDIERLPPDETQPTLVPLKVTLTAAKPNRYRTRFGWGTDTGFGLHFDWTRRYLWEKGHQLSLGTVVVQERKKLVADLNYAIPLDPLRRTRIELFARHQGKDLSYQDIELEEGGSTRILNNSLGLRWPRPTRSWGALQLEESVNLSYVSETYDVFDVLFGHYSAFLQEAFAEFLGPDRDILGPSFSALIPGIVWTHRSRNDALYTRRGDYLWLSLKGALKGLGSNISFWQAHLRGTLIRPLMRSDRLILRGELGYSEADSVQVLGINFNQMPELYEFRTGGDRSVRGYGYETLLPEDAVTGGKHLLVASVEYEKQIIDKWSAAVFLDAGNAFNDFGEMNLKLGTGVGARWRSPVGLVRLDIGLPLSDADDAFQIHFNIGPEF